MPVVRFIDIETSHNVVATFGLFDQNIPHDNILAEWFCISASWKDLGETTTHAVSVMDDKKRFKRDHTDDFHVITTMHRVLSEADIIVGHNLDRFDMKKLNARFIALGLPPLPKKPTVDTLKVCRREFAFTSNRLDYIVQYLGLSDGKMATPKGLWLKVLSGDKAAITTMVEYNKVDVEILEQLYLRILPYIRNHPHVGAMDGISSCSCPNCGSTSMRKRGFNVAKTGKRQRLQCSDCGAWSADGPLLKVKQTS